MPKPPQSHNYLDVAGVKTFYIQCGDGHPLILFHGGSPGTCSTVNWKLNIEPLAAAGYAVYAFDQPGFGRSENPSDYSLDFRYHHARAFIDRLKLERFHAVGNSMGAYLAARLALEDERAKKLVLISSNTLAPKGSAESQAKSQRHAEELRRYTPSMENMRQMTFGTIYHRELVTDELVRERYELSAGNNYQAQLKRYEAPRSRPLEERLPDLKCKTLIIWGKNDHGTSVEQAWLLFQKIPRAELHIFDEAAHWVHWDHAERVNGLIKSFLSGAD